MRHAPKHINRHFDLAKRAPNQTENNANHQNHGRNNAGVGIKRRLLLLTDTLALILKNEQTDFFSRRLIAQRYGRDGHTQLGDHFTERRIRRFFSHL